MMFDRRFRYNIPRVGADWLLRAGPVPNGPFRISAGPGPAVVSNCFSFAQLIDYN
jgi:hypothetical protein